MSRSRVIGAGVTDNNYETDLTLSIGISEPKQRLASEYLQKKWVLGEGCFQLGVILIASRKNHVCIAFFIFEFSMGVLSFKSFALVERIRYFLGLISRTIAYIWLGFLIRRDAFI